VRNITACPYAGVAADELFDVTPYAEAITRYFLRHPLSSTLPRKFKIAFEGCIDDHAVTAINDIGFRARVLQKGTRTVRGFQVTVAGGTSILCRSAAVLFDFLPAAEMLDVAEAVVRVFHRLGDYQHKQRNRMKFMIKALGWERWREEFDRELEGVRAEGGARLPFDPDAPPVEGPPGPKPMPVTLETLDPDYLEWERTNVRPQRQSGFAIATVALPLGDITASQMRLMADLAAAYGDGTVRITHDQDLLFRWVPVTAVRELYRKLKAAGLNLAGANTIADVTSCPGADSCRLAVTQSRGLGRLLEAGLRADTALASAAPDLRIRISGCPNGCGQHHIAGIGFQGSVKKVNHRAVPQYFVMVGGAVGEGGASFGRLAAKIPARRIPDALARLIDLYERERTPEETATAFFRRVELDRARACLVDLERLTAETATPDDYIDIGEDHSFAPEVLDGECSA
jgi:sulfite reductase (NADPH) hemoprotein beta-component